MQADSDSGLWPLFCNDSHGHERNMIVRSFTMTLGTSFLDSSHAMGKNIQNLCVSRTVHHSEASKWRISLIKRTKGHILYCLSSVEIKKHKQKNPTKSPTYRQNHGGYQRGKNMSKDKEGKGSQIQEDRGD